MISHRPALAKVPSYVFQGLATLPGGVEVTYTDSGRYLQYIIFVHGSAFNVHYFI